MRSQILATITALLLWLSVPARADIDHAAWDAILAAHVSVRGVNYDGIASERAALDRYLKVVAEASGELGLAFYLNAYNATVVASILDHGRPAKVLDVKGFFKELKHPIAKRSLTLDELETDIRKTYKDPRVHFALNCAARSCPPLHGRAFVAKSVDQVLGELTSRFLNGGGVVLDEAKKALQVSRLLDWFKEDFIAKEGSVEQYLKRWVAEPRRKDALARGAAIEFQAYDWTLNRR